MIDENLVAILIEARFTILRVWSFVIGIKYIEASWVTIQHIYNCLHFERVELCGMHFQDFVSVLALL